MTLEEAKNLREPDLIEVNYRGNWLRHNFKKLENGKVLIGNLALIKLEDCRLMLITENALESFGFKKIGSCWERSISDTRYVSVSLETGEAWEDLIGGFFKEGDHEKEIQLKFVHELMRYCKENNIEGKGWK